MIGKSELVRFLEEKKEIRIPEIAEHFGVSEAVAGKDIRYYRSIGLVNSKSIGVKKIFFISNDKDIEHKRVSLEEFLRGAEYD